MDHLTAIGPAGSLIAFIDFSFNLISGVNKVLVSSSGMTPENANLGALVEDSNGVTKDIISDVPPRDRKRKEALHPSYQLPYAVERDIPNSGKLKTLLSLSNCEP
ncbi:hypothetical protein N7448_010843 [Penicillium atrosanguineum]|nr:hypothetical protein N7448_010843 [Penicillium atrosanguineum]